MRINHYMWLADEDAMLGILRLLTGSEREFVPRLAERMSTEQSALLPGNPSRLDGLMSYYREILSQSVVVASRNDGDVLGFLSYKPEHPDARLRGMAGGNANYLTTLIVDPVMRRLGVAEALYRRVLEDRACEPVYARTWSSNKGNVALLEKLGFERLLELQDDRGDGVSTLYYGIGPRDMSAPKWIG